MDVFVARQPIFDQQKDVYAYDLLFRSGFESYYNALDSDRATADVIYDSFFVIGFDQLTDGRRAFINFTGNLLAKGVAELVLKEQVTVGIMEDIEPDENVIGICRRLKEAGFSMALDGFTRDDGQHPLIPYVDIVKVDFSRTAPEVRRALPGRLAAQGVTALAERVETAEELDEAADSGYTYFQGYFFSKPALHSGKRLSASKLAYLQILAKVNEPGISYDELESIIKQDVALVYNLLRFMNSAWFGLRWEVKSIRHALVLLGPQEIKKWLALVALSRMAEGKPQELMLRAIARAKIAEGLAELVGMPDQTGELFLVGMFSLIDALTDLSMAAVLAKLPLAREIKQALLGRDCPLGTVHEMIVAYEMGHWDLFSRLARQLRLEEGVVPGLFSESLDWANNAFAVV